MTVMCSFKLIKKLNHLTIILGMHMEVKILCKGKNKNKKFKNIFNILKKI